MFLNNTQAKTTQWFELTQHKQDMEKQNTKIMKNKLLAIIYMSQLLSKVCTSLTGKRKKKMNMRPYRIQIIRHKPKFVDFEKTTDKQNQKIAEHDQTNLMRSNLLCQQFLKHSQKTLLQITFLRYHDSMV